MGDDSAAEGAVNVGNLTAAKGSALAGNLTNDSGRQPMPNPDLHDDGVYGFNPTFDGDKMYAANDGHLKDDDYQQAPNVSLPGNATTNAGQQGHPVDWASVAPDTYPSPLPAPKGASFPLLPRV